MDEQEWLAHRFEENRTHLRAVAYRILGSRSDAEDAVQEAWLRLSRSRTDQVVNLGGWLTTVVARVALNMLQSRKARRELPRGLQGEDDVVGVMAGPHPEDEAVIADSVGPALLLILDTLEPAERLAFVLHDMFGVPFDEVAPIVGRSTVAARQLASRARRRVDGAELTAQADRARKREVVDAFLAASRAGHFAALLTLLDPQAVLRTDHATVKMGGPSEVVGARAVAETFSGRAKAARLALIDGDVGAVWSVDGRPRVVFEFTVRACKIAVIDMLAEPTALSGVEVKVLDGS